jgi:protein associated with RNAse G/E
MWKPGDHVVLRGIYNSHVWYIQSANVVHDTTEEVALVVMPGTQCAAPAGYITGKHGTDENWNRWGDYLNDNWNMQSYNWRTNRLLILLQPEKYYAHMCFWHDERNEFLCYYVNFQLPFKRTAIGFDTLDLELDIVVKPNHSWQWKDADDYRNGIECGVLTSHWIQGIEEAKQEIFTKLEKREYPFNGHWLSWMPDPSWSLPALPENWDKI